MKQDSDPLPESPLVRRALACTTYTADSIEEAVELATRFRNEGKYDWFRGQKQDWPLRPSGARRGTGPIEERKITEDLVLLICWLKRTPGLSKIAEDVDAVLSVAQHHGLPTSFLDFTTDPGVAGFFASSNATSPTGKGYIYCLNTTDLRHFDREMRSHSENYKEAGEIKFIRPMVPNLWRMEAQHGVFLQAPSNLFDWYLIDEIEFPHPSRLSFPAERDVYPERKSQLEIELNHFFKILKVSRFHGEIRKQFPDADIYHIEPPPNRVEANFFKRGLLPKMSCWSEGRIAQWQRIPAVSLRETGLGEIGLQVELGSDAKELRSRVAFGIRRALSLDPSLRQKTINWILLPQRRLQGKLRRELDLIWNGMRSLPYSDEVLAEAIGVCFALHRLGFRGADKEKAEAITSEIFGASLRVGLGDSNGSSCYGYVAKADLLAAIRSDIHSRILKKHIRHISYPSALLQLCSAPDRLFDFEPFARLFGSQIVPTQVMGEDGPGAFFSPARIEGFGLP